MKLRLALLMMLLSRITFCQTVPVPLPCDSKDFAKSVDSYRVVTPLLLYTNCGRTNLLKFNTGAILYVGSGGSRQVANGVTASVHLYSSEDPWVMVTFSTAGEGQVLQGGKDYELDLAPDKQATIVLKVNGNPAPMSGPFETLTIPFSTKPTANIAPSGVSSLGATFELYSNVALMPFDRTAPQFAELSALKTKIYHKAETVPVGVTIPHCSPGATCPAPPPAENNPETFGRARLSLLNDRLRQPKATLEVQGLQDLFGNPLKIQNDVTLGAVPKTKDDSMWYLKVNHQAGPGFKPGYAIEAKIAPDLGPPSFGGFTWRPALNMDIGAGTVTNVKVNDTIIPSLGLTQLFRTSSRGLQGVRVTPALSFETNREFNKENLLYDQDFQFFIGPLTSSRLVHAWQKFAELKKSNPDSKFSNDLASWGAGIQLSAGSELGGALTAQTVKASKSSSSVSLPTYPIVRIRPKMAAFAEYKRINLTFSVAARYLFTTEFATRESSDGKTIWKVPVSGFHPYGEASVNIGLDESGHIAFSTTYKLGAQPPTFQRTNVVQTGLLLKY